MATVEPTTDRVQDKIIPSGDFSDFTESFVRPD